ncbi:MAG: DUF5615 family PIN-like protein [Blastocatellales bacterium]
MRLLLDENFNHDILRGLRLRAPNLDYVVTQRTEFRGVKDPSLLEWAASANRVLVTHDISTIPKYAYERVSASLPMSGVIIVPEALPIGQAIEELLTIIECSDQSEYENQVVHIPL